MLGKYFYYRLIVIIFKKVHNYALIFITTGVYFLLTVFSLICSIWFYKRIRLKTKQQKPLCRNQETITPDRFHWGKYYRSLLCASLLNRTSGLVALRFWLFDESGQFHVAVSFWNDKATSLCWIINNFQLKEVLKFSKKSLKKILTLFIMYLI